MGMLVSSQMNVANLNLRFEMPAYTARAGHL